MYTYVAKIFIYFASALFFSLSYILSNKFYRGHYSVSIDMKYTIATNP